MCSLTAVVVAAALLSRFVSAQSTTCPAPPLQTSWPFNPAINNGGRDFGAPSVPQGKIWNGQPKKGGPHGPAKLKNVCSSSLRPSIIPASELPMISLFWPSLMALALLLKSSQETSISGAIAAMAGTTSLGLTPSKLVPSEPGLPIPGLPTPRPPPLPTPVRLRYPTPQIQVWSVFHFAFQDLQRCHWYR